MSKGVLFRYLISHCGYPRQLKMRTLSEFGDLPHFGCFRAYDGSATAQKLHSLRGTPLVTAGLRKPVTKLWP